MASRSALNESLGVLGPIELEEFREYLFPDELIDSSPRGMGGSPVNLLCKELLSRGHSLVVFTLDPGVTDGVIFEGERLRIHVGPHTNWAAANLDGTHLKYLSRVIRLERPRILHAHFMYEYALAAVASGLPHVVTAHDGTLNCLRYSFRPLGAARSPKQLNQAARSVFFRIMRTLMAYKAARRAQRVVAVSPYVAQHLRRFGFRANLVEVIPNGMPAHYFEKPRKTDSEGPLTFATVLVGWGGRKNGETAIKAFAQARQVLPDAQMMMFGDDHGREGPAAKWAYRKGLHHNITFVGRVPHADLVESLSKRVNVLVHTALEEAHPMAVTEAMSLGIPTIGGRKSGGVPWTLGDGKYGVLVDVRSPAEVASAMIRLACQNNQRLELGLAAREAARRRFHIREVANQYLKVYAELLTPKANSPRVAA